MHTVFCADITFGSRKAFNGVVEQKMHAAALAETHLDDARARRAQRQLLSCGYKTWLSQDATPTTAGAPPRGGAMIAARTYLDVRQVEVTTGLGASVDAELTITLSP